MTPPKGKRDRTRHIPYTKKLVHPPKPSSDIKQHWLYPYVLRFITFMNTKGFSRATQERRERDLRRFVRWCRDREVNQFEEMNKGLLLRYQEYLSTYRKPTTGLPLCHSSQGVLLQSLRTFLTWLSKQNYLPYNIGYDIELPKVPKRLPQVILSIEEVESIMNLPDTQTMYGIRDRAMLETLYGTGIRRTELINLLPEHIEWSRKLLWVREGKGKKDRVVPLLDRALYWLMKYTEEARPYLINYQSENLFLTDYGEAWIKGRLTEFVRKYLRRAGIDKAGACHLFRHAFATHMFENGADTRILQVLLGHERLETTQVYTRVSVERLRDVQRATHPAKLDQETIERIKRNSPQYGERLDDKGGDE